MQVEDRHPGCAHPHKNSSKLGVQHLISFHSVGASTGGAGLRWHLLRDLAQSGVRWRLSGGIKLRVSALAWGGSGEDATPGSPTLLPHSHLPPFASAKCGQLPHCLQDVFLTNPIRKSGFLNDCERLAVLHDREWIGAQMHFFNKTHCVLLIEIS